MAIYNGQQAAQDHLLEVTKACAVAASKAPQLTGRLELKMEILTNEDLEPMIDVLETLGKTSAFQLHDAMAFRTYAKAGTLPPVLLLGADLIEPVLWNCGACGFPTCGKFLKYTQKNKGVGIGAYGPSCLWKVIDFGVAADYACACAAMHRVEARLLFSLGAVSMFLNRLEGCSFVLGLPVGPIGVNRWFDRQPWAKAVSYEQRKMAQMGGGPDLFMAFSGGGKPIMKTKPRWWEDPTYLSIARDEAFQEALANGQADAYQKIMEYAGVVTKDDDSE